MPSRILLGMRNVPDKICREKRHTIFMFNNSFSENRAPFEIMWKNMVVPDSPEMTKIIPGNHFAYRTTTARTRTHIYCIYCLLYFEGNNGYANAPKCYVKRTLPVLLKTYLSNNVAYTYKVYSKYEITRQG